MPFGQHRPRLGRSHELQQAPCCTMRSSRARGERPALHRWTVDEQLCFMTNPQLKSLLSQAGRLHHGRNTSHPTPHPPHGKIHKTAHNVLHMLCCMPLHRATLQACVTQSQPKHLARLHSAVAPHTCTLRKRRCAHTEVRKHRVFPRISLNVFCVVQFETKRPSMARDEHTDEATSKQGSQVNLVLCIPCASLLLGAVGAGRRLALHLLVSYTDLPNLGKHQHTVLSPWPAHLKVAEALKLSTS